MAEKKEEKTAKNVPASGEKSTAAKKTEVKKTTTTRQKKVPSHEKQAADEAGQEVKGKPGEKVGKAEEKSKASQGQETKEEQEESYLKDIMAIGGHGGLFRFVSQGRNGIIVESLETGKRMQAFTTMKISSLQDIAIYTDGEEILLEEVFRRIRKYENDGEAISPKSDPDDLKDYFSAVIPGYDRERVYISDIKKVLGWYNFLLKKDMLEADQS